MIPVVDLRLRFALPESEYTQCTCIIVVQVTGVSAATDLSGNRALSGVASSRAHPL